MASAESEESKPTGEEGAAANPEHINLKVKPPSASSFRFLIFWDFIFSDLPGDGTGWQHCTVQDQETHSLEKADVHLLWTGWTCPPGSPFDPISGFFLNFQKYGKYSEFSYDDHQTIRFSFDGTRINESDTPKGLDMEVLF